MTTINSNQTQKIEQILLSQDALGEFAVAMQLSTKGASELLQRCLDQPTLPPEVSAYLFDDNNTLDTKSYICGEEKGYVRGHEAGFAKGATVTLLSVIAAAAGVIATMAFKK